MSAIETIQLGIPIARVELLDDAQMDACNHYSQLARPVAPTLFLEFHGLRASVTEQVAAVAAIAKNHGSIDFTSAESEELRAELWKARHDAYYAALATRPGAQAWTTDVCVPISKLAESITQAKRAVDASLLQATILGHVGDGNYHVILLVDPDQPSEVVEAARLNEAIVNGALELGGTCTGEHGVGYGKIPSLRREHGDAIPLMQAIKTALDARGLLNPGKIFESQAVESQADALF
jgi:D-lactate dehydrogenase (cytochrome)